jgi:hypothetical protein
VLIIRKCPRKDHRPYSGPHGHGQYGDMAEMEMPIPDNTAAIDDWRTVQIPKMGGMFM